MLRRGRYSHLPVAYLCFRSCCCLPAGQIVPSIHWSFGGTMERSWPRAFLAPGCSPSGSGPARRRRGSGNYCCRSLDQWPTILSLNTLTDGASTTSRGSPFHTLGVLTVRKRFLASKLNPGSLSFAPLERVLPSSAGENGSLPSSV
uniref:Uncharacterized protein n=1 Tax=Varanus komodoensis TaxID=61221 RepID=A0A8D2J385_VARKO